MLVLVSFAPAALAANETAMAGYIVVGLAPVADFEAYYAYNTVPTTVRFADQSTGTEPLTYAWDFGDGSTSTEVNPSHIYIAKGMYTVKLTVTNRYGQSTETKVDYIAIGVGPVARFSADPRAGTVPFGVKFTDESIGNPTTWTWSFGDGTSSSQQNPVHTYWASGKYTVILTASNEYGISDATKTEYIVALPALKSRFVATPMTGKAPLKVTFSDTSLGNPTAWQWDFGDGTNSTEQNPVHTFTNGASYDVSLTVSNEESSDKSVQVINVNGVPITDFVADKTSVSTGDVIQFTDLTKNSPTAWAWNFGDGSESVKQNPQKVYEVKGVYTVTLNTRNANGKDTEIKVKYINVGLAPVADFIISVPTYQNIPSRSTVRFIDRSQNLPTSWEWNFGDGTNSSEQNPTHLYTADGLYTVSLTAKNSFGQDTKVVAGLVRVGYGPKIDFKADRTLVSVDRYVHFTDLSTNEPNSWVWDFGDGTSGTGQAPDHAYKTIGVYDVTLTAFNQYTSTSLTKKQYIRVVDMPRANFVADKTVGNAPFAVTFTDLSKGNPTSWSWNFGDGQISMEQSPVHTYTENGVYTVSLSASNANGEDKETKLNYITVKKGPIADFVVNERIGKAPFIVKFQDTSAGNPTRWLWEFGDGTESTEQNPMHIYLYEGAYDVRLTVWNADGSDSIFKNGTTAA